jgi:hypothetical protein
LREEKRATDEVAKSKQTKSLHNFKIADHELARVAQEHFQLIGL